MSKKLQEEKRLKRLRDLMSQPDNKRCMDCLEKGPIYLCGTFGTFVCTTCAGVHREMQHRVKSVSMSSFTDEEVKKAEQIGNARARRIWLARWTPDDYPEPKPNDRPRITEFMNYKYSQKKWYDGQEDPERELNEPSRRKERDRDSPPRREERGERERDRERGDRDRDRGDRGDRGRDDRDRDRDDWERNERGDRDRDRDRGDRDRDRDRGDRDRDRDRRDRDRDRDRDRMRDAPAVEPLSNILPNVPAVEVGRPKQEAKQDPLLMLFDLPPSVTQQQQPQQPPPQLFGGGGGGYSQQQTFGAAPVAAPQQSAPNPFASYSQQSSMPNAGLFASLPSQQPQQQYPGLFSQPAPNAALFSPPPQQQQQQQQMPNAALFAPQQLMPNAALFAPQGGYQQPTPNAALFAPPSSLFTSPPRTGVAPVAQPTYQPQPGAMYQPQPGVGFSSPTPFGNTSALQPMPAPKPAANAGLFADLNVLGSPPPAQPPQQQPQQPPSWF